MKFIQTLAPIASLALAVSGESPPVPAGGNNGVKFSQGGVDKVLDVKANGSKGDIKGAINGVKKFFTDNPAILKSIMKVVNDPKHKKAKDEITKEGIKLHSEAVKSPDNAAIRVKVINYIYRHPEILNLAGAIGKQVAQDNPTLIQNGFAALEKAAAKNPEVFKKIRAKAIAFSEENEAAHEKIVEMILKSALKDVKLSAKIAKKALKLDQIICSGGESADCDCGSDGTHGKPDTGVDPEIPDINKPTNPEEVEYARPSVDGEEPEVTDPVEPTPYPEETHGKPGVDGEEPEVANPVEPTPYPEETHGKPGVDGEEPEVTDPVEPTPYPEETHGKPGVDGEEPEVTDPVEPTPYPEETHGNPGVDGEEPEVTDPVEPTPYPEETHGKPSVNGEKPEVTDPVDPASEPEATYGKPDVDAETPEVANPVDPEPETTYGRPSGEPKAIMDPK